MTITVKDDDMLSYLTVTIGSHGFSVKINIHARFRADVHSMGIELKNTSSAISQNIMVQPGQIDKLVYDERCKNGRESLIVVFPYGRTEEQVMEIVHPQLKELMAQYRKSYVTLLENADEMLAVLEKGPVKEHICPIKKA